jgi:hypothetical protein
VQQYSAANKVGEAKAVRFFFFSTRCLCSMRDFALFCGYNTSLIPLRRGTLLLYLRHFLHFPTFPTALGSSIDPRLDRSVTIRRSLSYFCLFG